MPKILPAGFRVRRLPVCHRGKCCCNRLNHCGKMAIFKMLKWRPSAISDFNFMCRWGFRVGFCVKQKFHRDILNACGYMGFTDFKMAAVRHFGYLICMLGPLANTTWWSLALCRLWFESAVKCWRYGVVILCHFGLKMPVHAPQSVTYYRLHCKSGNISEMVQHRVCVTTDHRYWQLYHAAENSVNITCVPALNKNRNNFRNK